MDFYCCDCENYWHARYGWDWNTGVVNPVPNTAREFTHLADVLIQGDIQRVCSKISLISLFAKMEPTGRSVSLLLEGYRNIIKGNVGMKH